MEISVVVAVYNDLEALKLIIKSLLSQTRIPDEIIVAEDAEHEHIAHYIKSLNNTKILHISQPDNGWMKEKILNQAIKKATGDYLIFIDGDCLPYNNFVQAHIDLSEKNSALCGRRTEPGESFSSLLRKEKISLNEFENNYLKNYFQLKKDNTRHIDEGIEFKPDSLLFKFIHKYGRKNSHIVGCNWSCYKEKLLQINGYDEDFTLPTTGEDTDIERRLKHFGVKMKSCRNAAIVIHLYHKKIFNDDISSKTEALMQTKKDIFICKNGLEKI